MDVYKALNDSTCYSHGSVALRGTFIAILTEKRCLDVNKEAFPGSIRCIISLASWIAELSKDKTD